MPRRADALAFAAVFAALTLGLGWMLAAAVAASTSRALASATTAVPAVSAMLAAVGFPWRRKLAYASATFGLYVLILGTADATGLRSLVASQMSTTAAFPSPVSVLYLALLTTFPFVMLLLFVGRTPTRLWRRSRAG